MSRRRRQAPLERALARPAVPLCGYAAAIASEPVWIWLLGPEAARATPPWQSLALCALFFALWRVMGRQERRMRRACEGGSAARAAARVLCGYAAALGSWQVAMWLARPPRPELLGEVPFPLAAGVLAALAFPPWWVLSRRARRNERADAQRSRSGSA